ncbi:MAG: hypothetical protein NC434_04280 [Ruminococcus sp.]|nr:hypothetical protein [Ruminococcus sp.]
MNLMEQNNEEQKKTGKEEEHIMKLAGKRDHDENEQDSRKTLIMVLIGIIIILLICICALLIFLPAGKSETTTADTEDLAQEITDYARQQKENDITPEIPGQDAIIVEKADITPVQGDTQTDAGTEAETPLEPETADKTAIIVDIEDENDVSYTKEFILNEMMPYFADNNLDAVWDLAHLKRYVKLSAGLNGTNSYYYSGDIDASGVPDGIGLAIYENNTYYYGSWSHGVRSGDGRWYRFYIGASDKVTNGGIYQAHSYAGNWSNDLPNGEGAEHYDVDISQLEVRERTIQNVIGNFTDGLYDGEMYANTVDYAGVIEEWEGIAANGVFDLWRDMSAIGECSVWRKLKETDQYMDIDKDDNKNQGMRELLKPAAGK